MAGNGGFDLAGGPCCPTGVRGRSQKYVEIVCKEMIPQAARRRARPIRRCVLRSRCIFGGETAAIFAAAREHGLSVRAHVGQLIRDSAGEIAGVQSGLSRSHGPRQRRTISRGWPRAIRWRPLCLALTTFLGLEKYPAARKFIDAGVPVALATDYNPGSSPTASMPFVMSLACTHMKMSPAEVVAAATINGACALRVQDRKGSIEPGKDADLAVFDVEDYREIPYWFASNRCALTVMNGALVASGGSGILAGEPMLG